MDDLTMERKERLEAGYLEKEILRPVIEEQRELNRIVQRQLEALTGEHPLSMTMRLFYAL